MRELTLRKMASLLLILSISLSLSGCFSNKVVLEQPGTACRTLQELKGVKVSAPGADGKLIVGTCDIPAGAIVAVPAPPTAQSATEEHYRK